MTIADSLKRVSRLFLDTAPVIYHIEGVDSYQALTDIVFRSLQEGLFEAVTTPITLAECLVQPLRRQDTKLVEQFRNVITAGIHTQYVGIDVVVEEAAGLRARYNLSLTDAFQFAAAFTARCDAFLTNDTALKRVTEIEVLVLDELVARIATAVPMSTEEDS